MINKSVYKEYISRINKVQDYIDLNIGKELNLKELADIAGFSQYHFHRIFSSIVNEPLNKYIIRLRIEKAAALLKNNMDLTITEIAYKCGFSNSSALSRSFKAYKNVSPSDWRNNSKNCIEDSKKLKESYFDQVYNQSIIKNKKEDYTMIIREKVDVRNIKEKNVAYIRHVGPYKADSELFAGLFGKLFTWAGARDLFTPGETEVLTIYHDDIGLTDEQKLRISVCMTVPDETEVSGDVGKLVVQGGKYAVGQFEINADEYEKAWLYMYNEWLPASGFQPDDRPCFELYQNDPESHPQKKHLVDIYIPVKPL